MIKMYTTSWCPDCHVTKAVLQKKGIPYEEINIESVAGAADYVMQVNGGKRSVPTLEYNGVAESMSRFSREKLDTYLKRVGLQ